MPWPIAGRDQALGTERELWSTEPQRTDIQHLTVEKWPRVQCGMSLASRKARLCAFNDRTQGGKSLKVQLS